MFSPAPLVVGAAGRVGAVAAELLRNRLLARPRARIMLPAPAPELYAALRQRTLPASAATALQTDELAGQTRRAGALRAALDGLGFGTVLTLDGTADPAAEADRYAAAV